MTCRFRHHAVVVEPTMTFVVETAPGRNHRTVRSLPSHTFLKSKILNTWVAIMSPALAMIATSIIFFVKIICVSVNGPRAEGSRHDEDYPLHDATRRYKNSHCHEDYQHRYEDRRREDVRGLNDNRRHVDDHNHNHSNDERHDTHRLQDDRERRLYHFVERGDECGTGHHNSANSPSRSMPTTSTGTRYPDPDL